VGNGRGQGERRHRATERRVELGPQPTWPSVATRNSSTSL
jgi:hypothetical protein